MSLKNSVATIILLGTTSPLIAAEASQPWKGEAELGIVATSGNTETTSVKARAGVIHENEKWRHTGKFDALNTSDATRTTSERYMLSGKSDYKFDDRSYAFGLLSYENDRFAGFDYRTSEILGYGYRVIREDNLTLDLEVGPGAQQTKLRDGSSENKLVGYLAGKLLWKISPSASLSEDLTSEISSDATIVRSVTALTAQLVGSLAMKLSFTARYTSEVPVTVKDMDTETAVTLVYGF